MARQSSKATTTSSALMRKKPGIEMKWQKGLRFDCGEYHTLVVTEQRELLTWGGNYYGQVGDGTTADRSRPLTIFDGGIEAVAAGRHHSLGVTTSGEVLAWGSNEDCLLGTGWKLKQESPTKVIDSGVISVAAGWRHSLALTEAGEVFAWGGNEYGQLGDGSQSSRTKPVKVIPGGVRAIAAGWYHSLALLESGQVLTWGICSPMARAGRYALLPMKVDGLHNIRQFAAGGTHSLALSAEGVLWAWGGNDYGQLGDGSMSRRLSAVPVANSIAKVAAGCYHSVALTDESDLLAWGFKPSGLPGGAAWTTDPRPSAVHLEGGAFAVAAGGVHSLALTHSGEVFAWGGNSCGQVGDGLLRDREFPVMILGSNTMETIPLSEQIEAIMKTIPKEIHDSGDPGAKHKANQSKSSESAPLQPLQRSRSMGTPVPELPVPELLLRISGTTGSFAPAPAATYPLKYNGSTQSGSVLRSRSLTSKAKTVSEWPSRCQHKETLPIVTYPLARKSLKQSSRQSSLARPLALTYG